MHIFKFDASVVLSRSVLIEQLRNFSSAFGIIPLDISFLNTIPA